MRRRSAFTLVELLVVIAIVGVLVALLLPAVQQAREAARRAQCKNNVRQLALALHNYESSLQTLPPGVLGTTGNGPQNHTWLALLLPYVEQTALYNAYNFNVRFDNAANATAVIATVPVFLCASQSDALVDNLYGPAHYAGNAGTAPGDNNGLLYPLSRVRWSDVPDGTSNTVAAGELAFTPGGWARGAMNTGGGGGGGGGQGFARAVLRWWKCAAACAKPGLNPPATTCQSGCERQFQFSSLHTGGGHFAFADGHTAFVSENLNVDVLRRLLNRLDGESIGDF